MKLNSVFFLIIFFLSATFVAAKQDSTKQYNNTFMFCATNYVLKSDHGYTTYKGYGYLLLWQDEVRGLAYQRKIWKNIYGKVAYNEWNRMPLNKFLGNGFTLWPAFDSSQPGVTLKMFKYKTADFYLIYKIDCFKRHKISASMGISYTWGYNEIIDSISYNPDPPHDGLMFTSARKKAYWGVVPGISYDYLLFRNRLAVGADLKYRRYTQYPFYAPEYGFHVGVNF